MKREGRQHGLVQTYPIVSSPRPESRRISNSKLGSLPTAGPFTKVSQKPTNHSKFTGKCGRPRCASCHIHPAGKAKDKTKGTYKQRSSDVLTDYSLVTWRVVDANPGQKLSGFPGTGILDHMANDFIDYDCNNYDDDQICDGGGDDYGLANPDWMAETEIGPAAIEIEAIDGSDGDRYYAAGDDDEDDGSFCDVGFLWKQMERDGDEGWCLVGRDLIN